jgi:hemoglobin
MGDGNLTEAEVFPRIGEEGFARIVSGFYRRVREDNVIGPLYPESDWEGAEKRFRDYLVYRFGGPQRYVEERGHPRLRMRHGSFPIGEAQRDRWLELMDAALDEAEIPGEVAELLRAFFGPVADFMRNQ